MGKNELPRQMSGRVIDSHLKYHVIDDRYKSEAYQFGDDLNKSCCFNSSVQHLLRMVGI